MCFDKVATGISKTAPELEVWYVQYFSVTTWPASWSPAKVGMVLCRSQAGFPVSSRTD